MAGQTKIGNSASQFPINKAVGQQHSAPNTGPMAAPSVTVPPPSPLVINGRTVRIDVRTMSGTDIVNVINAIPGVTASIDGGGRLTVTGVQDIDGEPNLRAILGI